MTGVPIRIYVLVVTAGGAFHFNKRDINYDDCWIYTGPAYWKEGYPIINRHGKNWIVSRFVWFLLTGRDYHSKEVHHTCHTRACCNPLHLQELNAKKHRRWHGRKKNGRVL